MFPCVTAVTDMFPSVQVLFFYGGANAGDGGASAARMGKWTAPIYI